MSGCPSACLRSSPRCGVPAWFLQCFGGWEGGFPNLFLKDGGSTRPARKAKGMARGVAPNFPKLEYPNQLLPWHRSTQRAWARNIRFQETRSEIWKGRPRGYHLSWARLCSERGWGLILGPASPEGGGCHTYPHWRWLPSTGGGSAGRSCRGGGPPSSRGLGHSGDPLPPPTPTEVPLHGGPRALQATLFLSKAAALICDGPIIFLFFFLFQAGGPKPIL